MYLVLKSCRASGQNLKAGDIVELPVDVAKVLLDIGRVEKTEAKPEVEEETRVVKPKRTRKAK